MLDVEHVIETVCEWMSEDKDVLIDFISTPEDKLSSYHFLLGTSIRNTFNMWEIPWTPDIQDGFDMSPNHPDNRSQQIIVEAWKRLRDRNPVKK